MLERECEEHAAAAAALLRRQQEEGADMTPAAEAHRGSARHRGGRRRAQVGACGCILCV